MSVDVLIVGGGPVGLVTALHAHQQGLTSAIIEPRSQPVDKACGEGIMPAGLEHLTDLGINPSGHDIRGIRYIAENRSVSAAFTHGPGRGVRRTCLQEALSSAVRAAGVDIHQSSVIEINQSARGASVLLRDGLMENASYIVGADGLHSTVRRLCGLETTARRVARRRGLRRHFALEPWTDLVEVHWARDAEAYVTPLGSATVGVAVLGERTGGFDEQLGAFPSLVRRLSQAEPSSKVAGAGPLRQRTTARTRGRVALVGDAAGYVDAITGEGLTVGWRQAEALIDAIASSSLETYERQWRRCTRRSTLLTTGLVAAARRPLTRRLIVPTAASLPKLFGGIVDLVSRG